MATSPADPAVNSRGLAIECLDIRDRGQTRPGGPHQFGYVWAAQLTSELRSSKLLTRAGDGHTSHLFHGPSRTRDAIDRHLVTTRLTAGHRLSQLTHRDPGSDLTRP